MPNIFNFNVGDFARHPNLLRINRISARHTTRQCLLGKQMDFFLDVLFWYCLCCLCCCYLLREQSQPAWNHRQNTWQQYGQLCWTMMYVYLNLRWNASGGSMGALSVVGRSQFVLCETMSPILVPVKSKRVEHLEQLKPIIKSETTYMHAQHAVVWANVPADWMAAQSKRVSFL